MSQTDTSTSSHSVDEQPTARKRLGLVATTALVVGGIIGTGIFTAPAEVAPYGWVTYAAFAIVTAGSVLLALTFAALARRYSGGSGPAYGYARQSFGHFAGFLSAWGYWIQGWTGQSTIAVAGAGYLASIFGLGSSGTLFTVVILIVLWLPVLFNLAGTRSVGNIQIVTTILKLLPLLIIGIAGILLFKSGGIGSPTGTGSASTFQGAIGPACAALLFSFLGMESAAVASERVRKPHKTVPRAVVLGVLACAVVYLIGLFGVQATIPQAQLADSTAPFADAATAIAGASWAGTIVSIAAVISALGALNGWTMVNAEMVRTASRDGIFPNVEKAASDGVPVRALLLNTLLGTVLVLASASNSFIGLFTTLALLSTFAYVFTYLLSMAAQLQYLALNKHRAPAGPRIRQGLIAIGALAFSIWMIAATGYATVYDGVLLILLGIPVYIADSWWRSRKSPRQDTDDRFSNGPAASDPS